MPARSRASYSGLLLSSMYPHHRFRLPSCEVLQAFKVMQSAHMSNSFDGDKHKSALLRTVFSSTRRPCLNASRKQYKRRLQPSSILPLLQIPVGLHLCVSLAGSRLSKTCTPFPFITVLVVIFNKTTTASVEFSPSGTAKYS